MYVKKRDRRQEGLQWDKLTASLKKLMSHGGLQHCDPVLVSDSVIAKVSNWVCDCIPTADISRLAVETASALTTDHPDYSMLAARIAIYELHKKTKQSFSQTIKDMYYQKSPLIADDVFEIIMKNSSCLDNEMVYDRDFDYDFFVLKILESCYLLKERPQHMWMRVAVGIHKDDIESVIKTYKLLSQGWFTHAAPTLLNAGTPRPQLSSCFLKCMKEDSIDCVYDTLKECAVFSKSQVGIGLSIHDIGANGGFICDGAPTSNGIVPILQLFNASGRYIDYYGRKGEVAVYLEPWHADIYEFLEDDGENILTALWIPDLFMQRTESDGKWSLFCPNECPGLANCWGDEFEALYTKYEKEGRVKKVVQARHLWFKILRSQFESGTPFMLYKDSCNRKSNQQNLGTIKSSNLCTEIIQYTSPTETAVCNLASIALPKYVREKGGIAQPSNLVGSIGSRNRYFDFDKLAEVTGLVTRNLNKIIDVNYYLDETTKRTNLRNRPMGIGVQGLADTFILLGMAFESAEAQQLNKDIFETIYYHALKASCELAQKEGGPYETYVGSPVSKGILQPDMWGVKPSDRWDWDSLRAKIANNGVRNSLLIALTPTAPTSYYEPFEPYFSNLYDSGEFVMVNKHLVHDLTEMGLWSFTVKNMIIHDKGSVQKIPEIPEGLKLIYKTIWEMKQQIIVDMAADRGCYIDQSQSLKIYMDQPCEKNLTALHFYAWRRGLKTGMCSLRSHAVADSIEFTVADTTMLRDNENHPEMAGWFAL
ncbi:hypothetical protein ACJIZ3_009979 [Penstemon smallii]|uniref:Ribonucleoside-diphosphate reductase n=1 Tax=Penstemon smallii TaxID=265156 RepID=A0ABD3TFU7_9LAMI